MLVRSLFGPQPAPPDPLHVLQVSAHVRRQPATSRAIPLEPLLPHRRLVPQRRRPPPPAGKPPPAGPRAAGPPPHQRCRAAAAAARRRGARWSGGGRWPPPPPSCRRCGGPSRRACPRPRQTTARVPWAGSGRGGRAAPLAAPSDKAAAGATPRESPREPAAGSSPKPPPVRTPLSV